MSRIDSLIGVRAPRMARLLAPVLLGIPTLIVSSAAVAASSSVPSVTTISLTAHAYKPSAAPGTTDDYHCTLVNPHVAENSYITSSQFVPGSAEDHHAALFLLPPSLATTAERDNDGGRGWTCFGLPLPSSDVSGLGAVPLLTFWAPGAGVDNFPKGSGVTLPAGSQVVMQVHYNLLVGDRPVKNRLILHTVPASTPLLPLHLDLMLAPPDIPCPTGVTGPLCNRAASLANLGQRFGQSVLAEVNGIEALCGNNPSDPPEGDSTTCTSRIDKTGYIVRTYAHMHLLGAAFSMVLNPGTPEAKTVLSVPNYDFHDQRSYNLSSPIPVTAGEPIKVTCTYEPTLAQELPLLRKAPPHFVTWGDGSTDEMCIGIAWTSSVLPNSHDPI
jgi:Copper type II ascorbate-dependent monooxygenase, C-terminal domain